MDLDHRFRPSGGAPGGRVILLGDGTEIEAGQDGEMFTQVDEDKDLESQVDKYSKDTTEVTESPSSVATEKSDSADASKDSADKSASK
jgi:protein phosphatase 2C family protein 2/3